MIRRPVTLLALLTALNLLNYLDRFVLSAVLESVKKELGLSDFLGGALATAFLVGYFATSPIFGTLADRGARRGLLAIGIAIWSVATIGSGLATNAWVLLGMRVLVGIGEASYATIAPTLIDDMAPLEKKGRWLAVFYSAMPIGSALGYLTGGYVDQHYGWREAFFVAGGPGLLLAGLCLLIHEPARKMAAAKPKMLRSIKELSALPLYRRAVFGYCAYTFAIGGFAYWAPTFLQRSYDLSKQASNFRFGIITVLAGAIGTAVGGSLADRWTKRNNAKAMTDAEREKGAILAGLKVCAIGSALGAPLAAASLLSRQVTTDSTLFFVFAFLAELALFLATSPISAVILRSVPTELRAGAMALSIFAIHLLGDLWSPPLTGLLTDTLPLDAFVVGDKLSTSAPLATMVAMLVTVPVGIAISAAIWWARRLPKGEAAPLADVPSS